MEMGSPESWDLSDGLHKHWDLIGAAAKSQVGPDPDHPPDREGIRFLKSAGIVGPDLKMRDAFRNALTEASAERPHGGKTAVIQALMARFRDWYPATQQDTGAEG
jgi:hypothetical protein